MKTQKNRTKSLLVSLCIPMLVCWGGSGWTQDANVPSLEAKIDSEIRAELDAKVAQIMSDKKLYAQAMEEGRARTILCAACHGKDGKSVKETVPNLAGQNATYIIDQFSRFSDGRRNNFMMTSLAKTFDHSDVVNIALYYNSLPPQSFGAGNTSLIPEGKDLYQERCASCHGENGSAKEGYANLAGQRPDYVTKILLEFKNQSGSRINPWMSGVAMKLTTAQINAIAAYLANLN